MPRYVINVTSNGHRVFSTSRSSIGTDKEKLQRLVHLFDILVSGAPEEEDMSMEVVLIGDAKAETCMLNGVPLSQVPQPMGAVFSEPFGNANGDTGADPRIAQVAELKNDGWHETANSKIRHDGQGVEYENWDDCIAGVFGVSINSPALAEHPVAQANKKSWEGVSKA